MPALLPLLSGFLTKNGKWVLYAVLSIIGYFLLRSWFKTNKSQLQKIIDDGNDRELAEMANDLAFNLGTHKEIGRFSIRASTENDQAVYNDLKTLTTPEQFQAVRMLYPEFTRTPRDLKNDLVKHLNDSLLKKLPLWMQ